MLNAIGNNLNWMTGAILGGIGLVLLSLLGFMTGIVLIFAKMMLTLMLTSKGVAAVPRASLVILLGTAASFGLPTWPIFIILGIDELMDMARTAINVIGNCLATVVVAKWEGEFEEGITKDELRITNE